MPVPIRIRSGSTRKHWPDPGRMILAHRLASRPDAFGQTLTRPFRSDPGRMREVGSGIYDLGPFWLHAGRNDHNWQPKRFRIGSGMFTGSTIVRTSILRHQPTAV